MGNSVTRPQFPVSQIVGAFFHMEQAGHPGANNSALVMHQVSADLMHHQRRIIGSWVTSLFHMEKCAHDLTDWKLWPRNAITHRFSLEQAGDAYALMASGKCGKVVINFPD